MLSYNLTDTHLFSQSLVGAQAVVLTDQVNIVTCQNSRHSEAEGFEVSLLFFFFFFPFQLPVSWDFPGMLRQGALAADHKAETFASSTKRLFTLQQAEEREARGLQQPTRNPTDFTREKQPAVPSGNSQLEMLGQKKSFQVLTNRSSFENN